MGYISDFTINRGIRAITSGAIQMFGDESALRRVEEQKAVFEGREDIINVLNAEQEKAKAEGEPFVADMERAAYEGKLSLEIGVDSRLRGAWACYKAGDELECIRYILLALGSICRALGWNKASRHLEEQSSALFKMKKESEAN